MSLSSPGLIFFKPSTPIHILKQCVLVGILQVRHAAYNIQQSDKVSMQVEWISTNSCHQQQMKTEYNTTKHSEKIVRIMNDECSNVLQPLCTGGH